MTSVIQSFSMRNQSRLSCAVPAFTRPLVAIPFFFTFFHNEGTFFGLGGTFTQATHVLCKDPEEVLVSHHQLRDGDAVAMVVLDASVPFLPVRRSNHERAERVSYGDRSVS